MSLDFDTTVRDIAPVPVCCVLPEAAVAGPHSEPFHPNTCPLDGAALDSGRPSSPITVAASAVPWRSPPMVAIASGVVQDICALVTGTLLMGTHQVSVAWVASAKV